MRNRKLVLGLLLTVSTGVAAGDIGIAMAATPFQDYFHTSGKPFDGNQWLRRVAVGKRTVNCRIESEGVALLEGRCEFQQFDKNGSFNISREDEKAPINEDLLFLTVTVTGKRQADVSAMTTGGHPSKWGPAKLSSEKKGCWVGEQFQICAY